MFIVVALVAAVSATAYKDTTQVVTSFGSFPGVDRPRDPRRRPGGGGAGGANNLVQSNWIRDKGFGMGKLRAADRVADHRRGGGRAVRASATRFPTDEANMSRWREWWKRANLEQFVSFAVIATVSITVFSLIAYSTVYGNPDLPEESGFDFISLEADVLDERVGEWFGTLFLVIGAVSLFAAALGIVDYVSRLVADVVRVGYTGESKRWTESRLYFAVVWLMIVFGASILLAGFDQPLVLVTISTVLGGVHHVRVLAACWSSRTGATCPTSSKLRGYRLGIMVFAILLLGDHVGDRGGRPVREPVLRRSIATVCLSGTLEDKLAAAAAAGFDEVELFEPDLIASPLTPAAGARAGRGRWACAIGLYQPFRDFEAVPRRSSRRTCAARRRSSP